MLDTTLQTRPDSRPDSIGLRYIGDRRRFLHRNSAKFYRVVIYTIPHYATKAIVKATLKEAATANTNSLYRKTARSPEDNVEVEPPSDIDDSSMIVIEIGVDVDEGPHLNMTIGGRGQSSVEPR
jgi:hypothetical protein